MLLSRGTAFETQGKTVNRAVRAQLLILFIDLIGPNLPSTATRSLDTVTGVIIGTNVFELKCVKAKGESINLTQLIPDFYIY